MDRKKFVKKVLSFSLFLFLSLTLGIYSGIRNAEDTTFQVIEIPELNDKVNVYRDSFGIPSILARNLNDLFFVQGYETARDRTWQLEFLHAVVNGRLSMLFGSDMVETDKYILTIGFKEIASVLLQNITTEVRSYLQSYVNGVNLYFNNHAFSLPWEFQLLTEEPEEWHIEDTLAVYGLFTYLMTFDNAYNELFFGLLINEIGSDFALELNNYENQEIDDYIANVSNQIPVPDEVVRDPIAELLGISSINRFGNNAIVLNGSKTLSGNPILSVNPNTVIQVPNIWYQINLKLNYGYSVQGYTIPGIPFLLIGHNDFVSWGYSPSHIDEVDMMYLESNSTHYYFQDQWNPFISREETIIVANSRETQFFIKSTVMGPTLNVSGLIYQVQWSFYDYSALNLFMDGLFQLNSARSINQAYNALTLISSPILNFLLAEVNGNIGRIQTGLVPNRETGYGYFPLNGSESNSKWKGFKDKSELIFEMNPVEGYYLLSDIPINNQSKPEFSGFYDSPARFTRLNEIIVNRTRIEISGSLFQPSDFSLIQNDVLDISADNILSIIENKFKLYSYSSGQQHLEEVIDNLTSWDYSNSKDSNHAVIYQTFMYFLGKNIFSDNLSLDLYGQNPQFFDNIIEEMMLKNTFQEIIDNSNTNDPETMIDIILVSLQDSLDAIGTFFAKPINEITWGESHLILFEHNIAQAVPIQTGVNLGPFSLDGSRNSIKSFTSIINLDNENPLFIIKSGSTMKIIMEVSTSWETNLISASPGMSGHVTSNHYDDSLENWLNGQYTNWHYNTLDIILEGELSAEFVRST